jgi:hypothetical protein
MNAEVDKVRHMAEAMETLSSCVVEPVLCLTGRNAHAFGAHQLIRGVCVVPVGQISKWLASRERTQPDEALPALAQRVDGLFPAATGPWSGLTPAPKAGNQIGSNRTSGSTPSRANAGPRTRTAQSSRRRNSTEHRVAKSLLVFLGMIAMVLHGAPVVTWVVTQVLTAVTHPATNTVSASTNASGQPALLPKAATGTASAAPLPPSVAAPSPPCRVLTESAISKALGVRVYPVATALPDTCQWGLRLDDQSTVVASASTGWMAAFNTAAIKANRAIYQDGPGSLDVSIIVPQHATVPGSKVPAAQITQPIKVSLVPDRLGKSGQKFSNDQARSLITKWAQQIATVMPQGPGADSIHP